MKPLELVQRLAKRPIGALLLSALLTGCQGGPEAPARPPLAVQAQETRIAPFADAVDTVSTLEALEEVQLAAQAGGRIQTLLVRQGDQVRQGQLLMVLDQTQA
ncbi:MAG: biotin/lipoyl-binding protein [Cyanobium sp.]